MAANYTITASLPLWTSEPQFSRFLALPSQQTVLTTVAILIPIHLVLVHIFRNHFSRQLYHRYPYCSKPNASQKPLSEMPLSAAHEILRTVSGKDFPYMFNFALQFALVRTYAIPTVCCPYQTTPTPPHRPCRSPICSPRPSNSPARPATRLVSATPTQPSS